MKKSMCPRSALLRIMTSWVNLLFVIIVGVTVWTLLTDHNPEVSLLMLVLIAVTYAITIAITPKYVTVDDEEVVLYRVCGAVRIPRRRIVRVEKYTYQVPTWRICGVGGMFSFTGWYYSKQLGMHRCYVTDQNRMYVIYREDSKPIVVSVEDATVWGDLIG